MDLRYVRRCLRLHEPMAGQIHSQPWGSVASRRLQPPCSHGRGMAGRRVDRQPYAGNPSPSEPAIATRQRGVMSVHRSRAPQRLRDSARSNSALTNRNAVTNPPPGEAPQRFGREVRLLSEGIPLPSDTDGVLARRQKSAVRREGKYTC